MGTEARGEDSGRGGRGNETIARIWRRTPERDVHGMSPQRMILVLSIAISDHSVASKREMSEEAPREKVAGQDAGRSPAERGELGRLVCAIGEQEASI